MQDNPDLYIYKAKVLSYYDADSCRVSVELGYNISMVQKVRLFGINAPEMRGEERERGKTSKAYFGSLLRAANNECYIESIKDKKGKYGRYLAKIWIEKFALKNSTFTNAELEYKWPGLKYACVNDLLVMAHMAEYKEY